jgi:hypothetical protein
VSLERKWKAYLKDEVKEEEMEKGGAGIEKSERERLTNIGLA